MSSIMEELKEGEVINCLARPFCIAKLMNHQRVNPRTEKTDDLFSLYL
jgi:hypothetical protein